MGKEAIIGAIGGLGEIGLNCMTIEYDSRLIVVDCGVMFPEAYMLGVDRVIPDFSFLEENREKLAGYVITHGHEDHIGGLGFALERIPAPVFATPFTLRLIKNALKEFGLEDTECHAMAPGVSTQVGSFEIEVCNVTHSIIDAAMLGIRAGENRILHTGDFKLCGGDLPAEMMEFLKRWKGADLLLSDSTNVEVPGFSRHESEIVDRLSHQISCAEGKVIATMFSSNVERLGTLVRLARENERHVAVAGRSLHRMIEVATEAGEMDARPSDFIDLKDVGFFPPDKVMILCTGSQAESRSALLRASMGEYPGFDIVPGDRILFSSKIIPGNERPIHSLINRLCRLGADVVYESIDDIHVSGHAFYGELERMIELTGPRTFIPVHGEYRHLVQHAALARKKGVAHARVTVNGERIALKGGVLEPIEGFQSGRVLIDGGSGEDIEEMVVRDRRRIGRSGFVYGNIVRDRHSGRVHGVDVQTIGISYASDPAHDQMLEEASAAAKGAIDDDAVQDEVLSETVRIFMVFISLVTGT
jgi:ribonuclease J